MQMSSRASIGQKQQIDESEVVSLQELSGDHGMIILAPVTVPGGPHSTIIVEVLD